jgi:ornithine cyclodeaminase/alanine dehydrogenase-like protein (mu-crystallin family)
MKFQSRDIPFLSEEFLRSLELTYEDMCAALRQAFRARGQGRAEITPKVGAAGVEKGFFHAMPAVLEDIAIVKWVANGAEPQGKYIHAHLIATDIISGAPLAIMDFAWLTGLRTAAVSAVGAGLFANPRSQTLAILGCGLQARTHLDALRTFFPLTSVIAVSRRHETAHEFATFAEKRGLTVTAHSEVPAAFYEADIILSATPLHVPRILDAARLKPGALMIAVDLAHPWIISSLSTLDQLVTDDGPHFAGMKGMHEGTSFAFDTDLPTLLAVSEESRWDPAQRVGFIPPGLALADAALARLIIEKMGLRS